MNQLGYQYEELSKSGINSSTTGHILSYCAACRTAMEIGGANSIHLTDLIFKQCYK